MSGGADGLLRVEVSLGGRLRAMALDRDDLRAAVLADFIEGDVQNDDIMARILLDDLGSVEKGEVSLEESSGNAFSVTIDPEGVLIENSVPGFEDWPSYRYRHDEFRHALEQVLTVLEERERTGKAAAA